MLSVLLIEPYFGGSHKQLLDFLLHDLNLKDVSYLATLPAKKWHWRARTGALRISQLIPKSHEYRTLFASCVLNMAELLALRPDLLNLHKIIYFHENQLVYPVQKVKERDFQYGYNQILSCLVADAILFNSEFNLHSFIDAIPKFMKLQPDCRPVGLTEQILPKCKVLYFPVDIQSLSMISRPTKMEPLHIVWPHRWEHDKDPDTFVSCLRVLADQDLDFRVSLLGQSAADVPPSVTEAREKLADRIVHWGRLDSRDDYLRTLRSSDVVVSTALHEFFGVAMLEATASGCYPLCPARLVYPEFYPKECLYKNSQELVVTLVRFCREPQVPRKLATQLDMNLHKFSAAELIPKYKDILQIQ